MKVADDQAPEFESDLADLCLAPLTETTEAGGWEPTRWRGYWRNIRRTTCRYRRSSRPSSATVTGVEQPVPFRQFVLKVHSRCDLACDYCYVYHAADQGWRGQPVVMSVETTAWAAQRIAGHAKAHELGQVHVVLHGGEPLLAGPARLGQIAATLREHLTGICELDLRIHTNGALLDEGFCELFNAHGVPVGISIDSDQVADRPGFHVGDNVGEAVHEALEALRRRDPGYRWLLVLDNADDPEDLDAFLPSDPRDVLITSRNQVWTQLAESPCEMPRSLAVPRQLRIDRTSPEEGRSSDRCADVRVLVSLGAS